MAQASAGWQNPQQFQAEFNITKSMLWKISIKIVENKATNCLGQTSVPDLGTWLLGVKPQYPREVGSSGKACAALQALGRRPGSLHRRGERRPDTGALPPLRELADAPRQEPEKDSSGSNGSPAECCPEDRTQSRELPERKGSSHWGSSVPGE